MALRAAPSKEAITALVKEYPGRFSTELGIDLSSGRSPEIFKWFLASVLFGTRISESIVEKTFHEFDIRGIVSPETILDTGWDGLVAVLDAGGYVRYDFKTATKLLDLCRSLTEGYGADLANLHDSCGGPDRPRTEAHLPCKGHRRRDREHLPQGDARHMEKGRSPSLGPGHHGGKRKGHRPEGREGPGRGPPTPDGCVERSGEEEKGLSGL